jgi:Arc/MetJ-type ribon-helix-helix transcriptional regulator
MPARTTQTPESRSRTAHVLVDPAGAWRHFGVASCLLLPVHVHRLRVAPGGCGMMKGMTRTKIAVSLPSELVEQAQRAVAEGRAPSVSAYVAKALEEQAKLDDLGSLLEEMLAESGGPLTAAERRAADRALGR